MKNPDVVILGGGAAGLMCAIAAGRRGRRVWVIEHANKIGKKILMSGGGRCNFTNLSIEPENYLSANPAFCRSALARYTQWDFLGMVEDHGIAWHEKGHGQLFCNDSSKQILAMLRRECDELSVVISTRTSLSKAVRREDGFSFEADGRSECCESLVIATGGLSIPKMGATGYGFELARHFGHRVLPTRAGLVPLTLSGKNQEDFDGLAGLALPVRASTMTQSFTLPMLLTHRGLSGPAMLQISSYWRTGEELCLDLLPGTDAATTLRERKASHPESRLENWLARTMPQRLAERLCALHDWRGPLQQHKDAGLTAIGERLNAFTLRPSGTEGYRTAEVTLGGVDTHELSSQTMASRLVPGLYFIGEVVDVTGHLGGYNFQWAWASGHACGLVC